jgi:hypothetical protein
VKSCVVTSDSEGELHIHVCLRRKRTSMMEKAGGGAGVKSCVPGRIISMREINFSDYLVVRCLGTDIELINASDCTSMWL